MFIVRCERKHAKLRRSGMCAGGSRSLPFLVDLAIFVCRSYGAWGDKRGCGFYKHGAPNGAFPDGALDSNANPRKLSVVSVPSC